MPVRLYKKFFHLAISDVVFHISVGIQSCCRNVGKGMVIQKIKIYLLLAKILSLVGRNIRKLYDLLIMF